MLMLPCNDATECVHCHIWLCSYHVPIYAWLDPVGRVKITKTSTDVVIASDASTANGIDAAITSHLSLPFLPLLLLFPFSHSPTLLFCCFSHSEFPLSWPLSRLAHSCVGVSQLEPQRCTCSDHPLHHRTQRFKCSFK